jgi:hypothetical protein
MLNSKLLNALATAALVAAPIAVMGAAPAQAADFSLPGVYMCTDANYVGCRYYGANGTTPVNIYQFGQPYGENDVYSSLKIVGPYKVTVYKDTNLNISSGWQDFYFDDPNLADDGIGNDTASSLKIQYSPGTQEGVFLSTDAGYMGATSMYIASASTVAWDNMFSSLKIHGRYKVTLYSEANFTGSSITIDPSVGNPTDVYTLSNYGFNDTVSSVKVEKY